MYTSGLRGQLLADYDRLLFMEKQHYKINGAEESTPAPTREQDRAQTFTQGLKAGLPIAIGYLPIAIAFGLLARSAGVSVYIAVLMSILVFAGASQFIAAGMLALGTHAGEIVLTTFVINLRHFLMSASLSQRLAPELSKPWRSLLAFGVTDESFTVASLQSQPILTAPFILGLNLIAYLSWVAGTGVGVLLAGGLPAALQASMGIALYAMFIGLLVPSLRKGRPVIIVVLAAIVFQAMMNWVPALCGLATGWKLVLAASAAAMLGAACYPQGVPE
ncbi:MAG: AzlC family ABC transporter permease [Syntrophomonadaceae bacterium]|jgi:4-azaleucine resistance transporter AzlC